MHVQTLLSPWRWADELKTDSMFADASSEDLELRLDARSVHVHGLLLLRLRRGSGAPGCRDQDGPPEAFARRAASGGIKKHMLA